MKDHIKILMYHAVVRSPLKVYDWCYLDEDSFFKQAHYLSHNFDVISLSDAVDLIKEGRIEGQKVVITFDDGFQNNSDIAFKILDEFRLPATIFLVTGLINTSKTLWYCLLNRAISNTSKDFINWNGRNIKLSDADSRSTASWKIQDMLKKYEHHLLMNKLGGIIKYLGDSIPNSVGDTSPYRILNLESVKEMSKSNLIEFGAHTDSHAILSLLSKQSLNREVNLSIESVYKLTGKPCRFFAYPNGKYEDYDEEIINLLSQSGIIGSVTSIPGNNGNGASLMELKRYGIGANITIDKFKEIMIS